MAMKLKINALFKKASPKAPAKKAAAPKTGTKRNGGWLGSASGSANLDKWYGEWPRSARLWPAFSPTARAHCVL